MSRKDTLEEIAKKLKEIEDLERELVNLEIELKERPPIATTVDIYLHSSKESMYRHGKKAGLSDTQLELFVYACQEVTVTLSVNEKGKAEIIAVDGRPFKEGEKC